MRITRGEALEFTESVMSKTARMAHDRGDDRLADAMSRKATEARRQLEDMPPEERERPT